MSCSVCQHPKRQEIDQALAAASATLTVLSQEYGLSTSALHRHKAHMQGKMMQAKTQLRNNLVQSCFFWLSQASEMVMETAKKARAEGNSKLVLQAISQGTRLINIMLKQDFPLEDRMLYAILESPQWAAQSALLPDDPNIMALCRKSLAGILSTPCPDGPPPPSLTAFPGRVKLDALQTVPSLPANPQPKTKNRKLQTDNGLSKWEKSGKLPGYECHEMDEEEQYRILELEKKISQLDLDALTRGLPPAAANDKLEALMEEIYNSIPIPKDKPLSEYLPSMGETQAA